MGQEDRTTGLVGFSGMKVPVRLATTANLTLSGEQTIDGVAAVTGDRVLVKDQTTQTQNGIYVVDTGDWNRAADCDGSYDLVQGSVVYVNAGTTNTGFWYCTSANPVDIESDNITWARASSVLAAVTPYIQTLLDDATAAAARTTLDAAQLTSSLAEDTAPDKIADFLHGYDTSAAAEKKLRLITALARAMPFGQGLLINGKIVTSVASNALTVAVKTDAGSDPSSTDPVYALFRKSTLTDSGFDLVPITAALSVVVSSGSTLGHASAIAQHIFVYLINNAGAAELAVSNLPPDYPGVFGKARLVSTTAEGGAGAADSATGVYSTTARSNVPWVCVAKILTTQTTAGTWAAAITQIDQAPFVIPTCAIDVFRNGSQSIANATWTELVFNNETVDVDSTFNTTTGRWQPNVAGLHDYFPTFNFASTGAASRVLLAIYKNGSPYRYYFNYTPIAQQIGTSGGIKVLMNGTSDYLSTYIYQDSGGAINVDGSAAAMTGASGSRVAGG